MIRLADLREMLVLLIKRRRWAEGVLLSILASVRPLSLFFHFFDQDRFVSALRRCWTAEGLVASLRHSIVGSDFLLDCCPSAALLASLSAVSLPGMPACPAVHCSVNE